MWAFLEQTQPHRVLAAAIRAAEILGMLLDDEDVTRFGEHRDELAGLLPLLGVDRFDRRKLNRALLERHYALIAVPGSIDVFAGELAVARWGCRRPIWGVGQA